MLRGRVGKPGVLAVDLGLLPLLRVCGGHFDFKA